MPDLNALLIFAKVAEAQSFSEAARRLNKPVSTVSRKVAELEAELGVRLLERSTRQLRLTDIGCDVLDRARQMAEINDSVIATVSNQVAEVRGTLCLSAPPSIADTFLAPLIMAFNASYPKVRTQVLVTERFVDHIAEGFDLTFRIGRLKDSSLVQRRVLLYRHRLLASPAYLHEFGSPKSVNDLTHHRLVAFGRDEKSWTLMKGSRTETIEFQPFFAINDYHGLARALSMGAGIGELPPIACPDHQRPSRLVEVLPDWQFGETELSLIQLAGRQVPRHVRLFKELATQMVPKLYRDFAAAE